MSGELGLPAVPEIHEDVLVRHAASQSVVRMAFDDVAAPVRQVAGEWFFQLASFGLAGLTPSLAGLAQPLVFPAPRAFLSAADRARLEGCAWALDHVSLRKNLVRTAHADRLLRPETPYVLHALAEGRETGDFETNPGALRTSDSRWRTASEHYEPPDAAWAADLMPLLIDAAMVIEAPGPVVGGWMAFSLMSIHPFLDGNGRTARLLYLLMSSLEAPTFVDVGVVEQMAADRPAYVEALQAGQHPAGSYLPERLDAEPFTRFVIEASIRGADRSARRLEVLGEVDRRLLAVAPDLSDEQRAATLRVWLERVLAPEQLLLRVVEEADWSARNEAMRPLEELVAGGVLERLTLPAGRRRPGWRGIGYRVAPAVLDVIGRPLQGG